MTWGSPSRGREVAEQSETIAQIGCAKATAAACFLGCFPPARPPSSSPFSRPNIKPPTTATRSTSAHPSASFLPRASSTAATASFVLAEAPFRETKRRGGREGGGGERPQERSSLTERARSITSLFSSPERERDPLFLSHSLFVSLPYLAVVDAFCCVNIPRGRNRRRSSPTLFLPSNNQCPREMELPTDRLTD